MACASAAIAAGHTGRVRVPGAARSRTRPTTSSVAAMAASVRSGDVPTPPLPRGHAAEPECGGHDQQQPGEDSGPKLRRRVRPGPDEEAGDVLQAVGVGALREQQRRVVGRVRVLTQHQGDERRPGRERQHERHGPTPIRRARDGDADERHAERRQGHDVAAEVADGAGPVVGRRHRQVVGERCRQHHREAPRAARHEAGGGQQQHGHVRQDAEARVEQQAEEPLPEARARDSAGPQARNSASGRTLPVIAKL